MENKLGILDTKKPPDLDVRLDEENEIPSIFSCHHPTEAKRSSFQLHETKHKIFLSHSGAEKSFVEQLCVDLERSGYFFPFFDQRSHSLPKGKTFPTLILQAAKQCHVAVIVLSKTFLTSKWPMIELAEFYKARKAGKPTPYLLPLFFKVSIKDLDEQSIEELWMPTWEKFHAVDKRIDLGLWKRAVEALPKTNAFIFEQAEPLEKPPTGIVYRSEVDYRNAAREAIQRLSPPDLLYGSGSTMVGYERLCQILSSQFVEENETGLLLLGLYGMPGLGKSTMSKAICDYFQTKFGMTRVCRLEFSNVSTTRFLSQDDSMKRKAEILMHQKEVLNKLWCVEARVLNAISDIDQARNLMQELLKLDKERDQQPLPVLLVIDNVGSDHQSYNATRAYLQAGFPPRSRIMVTSRGHNIVESLLQDARFCKPVPDLSDEEARTVFLNIAASGTSVFTLTDADSKRILGLCVNQCRFSVDGAFRSDAQYHPLALIALANFCRSEKFRKRSLSSWEEELKAFNRGSHPDLFDILELQFTSMDRETEQLIFLDIALFGREWYLTGGSDWWSWLAELHNTDSKSVEMVVRQLEKYGVIYHNKALTMHQLYRDFAVWFVTTRNFHKNEWRVSEPSRNQITRIRGMNLKGRNIVAMRLKTEIWENLVLLQLHSCSDIEKLDLKRLESLCHLELINLPRLKALILAPENDLLRFVWLSGLDSLQHLPDINTCCPNLQVMIITRCLTMNVPVGIITDCKELKSLHVDTGLYQALGPGVPGTSLGSNLMKLEISNLKQASEEYVLNLEGLGRCDNLEWLILKDLPVKRISGLEEVKSLQRFGGRAIFYNCGNLEQAPEGASEIHSVYKITSDGGYLWAKHKWKEGTTRAEVISHYVDRWGRDEDFCDYGDIPRYWVHQPRWNMNSNIW